MIKTSELKNLLAGAEYDEVLAKNYKKEDIELQKERYTKLAEKFEEYFGNDREVEVYSAPGRTEVGGNHTDHQHGCVLAGSVQLDIIAVVSENSEDVIRIKSKGYDVDVVDLGVPVLSMHAPYEVISKFDLYMAYRAFTEFFKQ